MAKSMVFSPRSRTADPFLHYTGKYKLSKAKVGRQQHGIKTMPCLTFMPLLSPNIILGSMTQVRPGLEGLTKGIGLTL